MREDITQFLHNIRNLKIETHEREARLNPSSKVMLVADALSPRMKSLRLAIRFCKDDSFDFLEIKLPDRITKDQYPAEYNRDDPAMSIADEMSVRMFLLREGSNHLTVKCGKYMQEVRFEQPIASFLENPQPAQTFR